MDIKNLPPLSPIPDNIAEYLQNFLQTPADPALEDWLAELLRASSHIATADALRWRVLVMVWLAAEFDIEKSWQYLMWFNMNEPVMGDQVAELLTEAADEFGCHLQLAHWIAHTTDERLKTFFTGYKNIPGARQFPPLMDWLFAHPTDPRTKTWLAGFLRDTVDHPAPTLRGWRILAAIWFAAVFDAGKGLEYLQEFLEDGALSEDDCEKLAARLREHHRLDAVRQWVAECPRAETRAILRPLLPDAVQPAAETLAAPADFSGLDASADRAAADAAAHRNVLSRLTQAGIKPDAAHILAVGGGMLAPDAALFGGQKIRVTGVDTIVPPAFLPVEGIKAQLKRNRLKGAWKSATADYYRALAEKSGIKPKWKSVNIILADPAATIPAPDGTFDAAVCRDFLPHTPDVSGVLAEVARLLKPGGVFIAEFVPFTALGGAFSAEIAESPWAHLDVDSGVHTTPDGRWLNRWRLSQYQAALVEFFEIEQWQIEKDPRAAELLSPRLAGLLERFAPEELTAARLWVVARKR